MIATRRVFTWWCAFAFFRGPVVGTSHSHLDRGSSIFGFGPPREINHQPHGRSLLDDLK